MMFARSLVLGICVIAALQVAPAVASAPIHAETALRNCGEGTCLLITGRRVNADAPVLLAGHEVAVQGGRSWRISVPLETVKAWSNPFARYISVHVGGINGDDVQARLPIGLFGHITALAFLEVHATR